MQSWQAEYPFRSNWFDLDSHRYHYIDEGSGEAPVLFVHGNPTWSFYWRKAILAIRPYQRTIAVDHLGCGLSDKPQKYPYSLSQHIENLSRFIESLDLNHITLVVHDWGGAIGLGTAVKMPHRFDRLVILNTAAFPPPYIPWRIGACRIPILGTLALRGLNLFSRAALSMAVSRKRSLRGNAALGLLAPYNSWSNRVAVNAFVKDIPASRLHPTWGVLEQIEQRLNLLSDRPTMMIWGMKDWCFRPECLSRLNLHFPDAEIHRLEDVGHYVTEDAPEQVHEYLLNFLKLGPHAGQG